MSRFITSGRRTAPVLLAITALTLPALSARAGEASSTAPDIAAAPSRQIGGQAAPPSAAAIFARIRTAQADAGKTDAGKGDTGKGDTGRTDASKTDAARTETAKPPTARQQTGDPSSVRQAADTTVTSDQPLGPFPTNETTTLPWIGINGDAAAYRADVGALQQTLIEIQQLKLQTKQAHWNASGSLYYPLHLLLQEHKEGLEKLADTIAERLLAIGSSADGRANTIVKTSGIPEIPGGFLDDAQILKWFTLAYKRAGVEVQAGVKATEKADPTSSNLLQEVEQALAKYQWQMRAHLQRTGTDPNTGWDLNDRKAVELPSQPAPGKP